MIKLKMHRNRRRSVEDDNHYQTKRSEEISVKEGGEGGAIVSIYFPCNADSLRPRDV